jgi:hypothetical protein
MGKEAKTKPVPTGHYTKDEIVDFKEAIIQGLFLGYSLMSIIRRETKKRQGRFPSRKKVYQWLNPNHENYDQIFRNDYAGAREDQADFNAEKIEEIAEKVRKGKIDPSAGRVAIDALKWAAGRKKPSVYGDRIDVTSAGAPIESQVVVMLPDNGRD